MNDIFERLTGGENRSEICVQNVYFSERCFMNMYGYALCLADNVVAKRSARMWRYLNSAGKPNTLSKWYILQIL